MNAQPRSLFPRYTLWLILAGVIAGGIVGMYLNFTEKIEFESVTLCRPVRPATAPAGASPQEWVKSEAAAMGSQENLLRVVRNLNLDAEWNMTPESCVERLRKMIAIETASGDTLIRVVARSSKTAESASLVNGVVVARGEFYREKEPPGQTPGGKQYEQRVLLAAHVETLDISSLRKRVALREALEAAKLMPEFGNDAAIKGLTLTGELEKLRGDWLAETAQLEKAKAELAALAAPVPGVEYAEILEKGVPAMNPVDPGIRQRSTLWTLIGGGAGLLLSLILGRFGKVSTARPRDPKQVTPVEY
ncbi:MAG TPA: hypothetical protein VHM91_06115 [Verrucomicrobiales bacterium]|jgi:hypothetical protein|nr:hypothetical protein [Verrucomicrobiales bacterium]